MHAHPTHTRTDAHCSQAPLRHAAVHSPPIKTYSDGGMPVCTQLGSTVKCVADRVQVCFSDVPLIKSQVSFTLCVFAFEHLCHVWNFNSICRMSGLHSCGD